MPSSWPQPAVLTNLLSPSTDDGCPGADDGKSTTDNSSYDYRVLSMYKFSSPKLHTEHLPSLKMELQTICRQHSARGTLLIAEEGINGTICYPFKQSKSTAATDVNTKTLSSEECSYSTKTYDKDVICKKDKESRDELLSFLQEKFDGFSRIRISVADRPVFARLKIKIKSEIVTMQWQGDERFSTMNGTIEPCNRDDNDDKKNIIGNRDENSSSVSSSLPLCGPCCPTERVGEYVRPRDWNKLLMDPDTLVIDTRNEYEIDVGTFRNAINPQTQSFIEFPDWIKRNLVDGGNNETSNSSNITENNALEEKKKIAMFCTGGIRCEKATNVAMQLIPNDIPVYHLEGGILAYLDEISEEESMFDGECYVFDQRVAVTYKNRPSTTFRQKCYACRHPLSNKDLEREDFKHGVSCKYCVGQLTHKQVERFAQRQRQMELALKEGRQHIHDSKEHSSGSKTKKTCLR